MLRLILREEVCECERAEKNLIERSFSAKLSNRFASIYVEGETNTGQFSYRLDHLSIFSDTGLMNRRRPSAQAANSRR
jgi:hypothetical protein